MTQLQFERRLNALEREVAELKLRLAGERTRDWRRTIGMFAGDDAMKEIMDEALKFRERDRAKARRSARKVRAKA